MLVRTVATLREFTEFIEIRQQGVESRLWYRGLSNSQHRLVPSLYRHSESADIEAFAALEHELLARFRQRSIPYLDRQLYTSWDYLFVMQHYGVPTRLLDWTENPYIALFFALSKIESSRQSPDTLHDAAIWILDPAKWNRKALDYQSFSGGILSPEDSQVGGYAAGADLTMMNNHPVAIFGAHNSTRIVAQRGVFTIFGKDCRPMDQIYTGYGFPEDCLVQLQIPATALPLIKKSLESIGITASVVFPDLEGLAQEIRWHFGFGR